jgi:hypothetical protein
MAGFMLDSQTTSMIAWCDITEYAAVLSGTVKTMVSITRSASSALSRRNIPNFEFNPRLPFNEQTPGLGHTRESRCTPSVPSTCVIWG